MDGAFNREMFFLKLGMVGTKGMAKVLACRRTIGGKQRVVRVDPCRQQIPAASTEAWRGELTVPGCLASPSADQVAVYAPPASSSYIRRSPRPT